jgi:hypothetical protein
MNGRDAFSVHNSGKYILTGVSVKFVRTTTQESFSQSAVTGSAIVVGTLYPGEIRLVSGLFITPKPEADGIDSYWLFVSAQNGLVAEVLSFRRRKDGTSLPWAYSFHVSRVKFHDRAKKPDPSSGVFLFLRTPQHIQLRRPRHRASRGMMLTVRPDGQIATNSCGHSQLSTCDESQKVVMRRFGIESGLRSLCDRRGLRREAVRQRHASTRGLVDA